MKTRHLEIRQVLRRHEDGLTAKQIAELIATNPGSATAMVKNMPDAYIDRWIKPRIGPYTAVWCVAQVPENCPHPKGKRAGNGKEE